MVPHLSLPCWQTTCWIIWLTAATECFHSLTPLSMCKIRFGHAHVIFKAWQSFLHNMHQSHTATKMIVEFKIIPLTNMCDVFLWQCGPKRISNRRSSLWGDIRMSWGRGSRILDWANIIACIIYALCPQSVDKAPEQSYTYLFVLNPVCQCGLAHIYTLWHLSLQRVLNSF